MNLDIFSYQTVPDKDQVGMQWLITQCLTLQLILRGTFVE